MPTVITLFQKTDAHRQLQYIDIISQFKVASDLCESWHWPLAPAAVWPGCNQPR